MARRRNALRSVTRLKMEQVIRLQMLDKSNEEIAAVMGMTAGSVAELISHKDYEELRDKYVAKTYGPVDKLIETRKASTILDEAAPDAAEALAGLLDSEDEVTVRIASTAILDRTGHGPIQRKAVKHRHEIDPVTAKLLTEAMREADVIDVEPVDEAAPE